jgi:hypothetical protein
MLGYLWVATIEPVNKQFLLVFVFPLKEIC